LSRSLQSLVSKLLLYFVLKTMLEEFIVLSLLARERFRNLFLLFRDLIRHTFSPVFDAVVSDRKR
jgi:hypothetical protein